MHRAYSLLDIKEVSEEKRIIEGIATTPATDRVGDIVEPMGAKFALPMPLLWQHRHDQPIGFVEFAKATKDGIPFRARLARADEPGTLKDRLDEAWQSIKLKLVRAVSIGFKINEYSNMEGGGWRITDWEWLELSAVTVPANQDATITAIRSIDAEARAASGRKGLAEDRSAHPAGASARTKTAKIVPKEGKTMKKTIAEQIAAFEATRLAKAAEMDAIMDASAESGETLDAEQKETYDTLASEVKEIDEHLIRLREREKSLKAQAKPVNGEDEATASASRDVRAPVQVKRAKLEKGIAFTRYVGALANAKGNRLEAAEFAKQRSDWKDTTPEVEAILRMPSDIVLKAAVNPGTTTDTTWAAPLVQYQDMASEFIDYLRPMTIIGRIQGFRRVPFKIRVPRQTGAATVNWVGETKVKPLSSLAFDSVTLDFTKIAGIVPLSEELVRFSTPSAEMLVRDDLAAAVTQFMDSEFIDPTKAATDVSPASVTNGVSAVTATGTTAAAFRADVKTMFDAFLTANISFATGHWVMTQAQALSFSLMQNALGQPEFPGITMNGGTLLGFPIVATQNIPSSTGSPADGYPIVFVVAGEIMLADDGGVSIDMSREASLQMESAPDSPAVATTVLVSLWQHNLVAIKAERFINWVKRRSTAVGLIAGAKYAE